MLGTPLDADGRVTPLKRIKRTAGVIEMMMEKDEVPADVAGPLLEILGQAEHDLGNPERAAAALHRLMATAERAGSAGGLTTEQVATIRAHAAGALSWLESSG